VATTPAGPAHAAASALLERLGLAVRSTPAGVLIVAIDLDGPAAQGGAHVGDLVLGVNGTAVASAADFDRLVAQADKDALSLEVLHDGTPRQVAIAGAATPAAWNPLGLQVRELPAQTLKALGLSYGVMVAKVRAPADRTRILPGDVIVAVNQTRIRSLEEFNKLVSAPGAEAVGLLVRRTDSDLYIAIRPAGAARGGDASRGGSPPRPEETFKTRQPTGTPLRI
jgi:serine protease Do